MIGDSTLPSEVETNILTTINNISRKEVKELAMRQIEYLLFMRPTKANRTPQRDPILALKDERRFTIIKQEYNEFVLASYADSLIFKNLLMKRVNDNVHLYREKLDQYYNDTVESVDNEKDPVKVEFEKFQNLDNKTKQIYDTTSKKTIDLLNSLQKIKSKNNMIFKKNLSTKQLELPAWSGIFNNLVEDEEEVIEKDESKLDKTDLSGTQNIFIIILDINKPLLKKLQTRHQTLKEEEFIRKLQRKKSKITSTKLEQDIFALKQSMDTRHFFTDKKIQFLTPQEEKKKMNSDKNIITNEIKELDKNYYYPQELGKQIFDDSSKEIAEKIVDNLSGNRNSPKKEEQNIGKNRNYGKNVYFEDGDPEIINNKNKEILKNLNVYGNSKFKINNLLFSKERQT